MQAGRGGMEGGYLLWASAHAAGESGQGRTAGPGSRPGSCSGDSEEGRDRWGLSGSGVTESLVVVVRGRMVMGT